MMLTKTPNKKAILLPEGLKIIIAVLCILILIYLAWSLYSMLRTKTMQEQAKETLKQIVDEINGLKEGEQDYYVVVAPKGWALISKEKKLCICNIAGLKSASAFSECVKSGVCYDLNIELRIEHSFNNIPSTFLFKELPITLFFIKKGEYVDLKTEGDLTIEKNLEDILEYKKDENSKSVKDLVFEYITVSENKDDIRKEINDNLKNFFSKLDTKSLFGMQMENFGWRFEVFRKGEENSILRLYKDSRPTSRTEIFSTTLEFEDNKEYFAKLIYYREDFTPAGSPKI